MGGERGSKEAFSEGCLCGIRAPCRSTPAPAEPCCQQGSSGAGSGERVRLQCACREWSGSTSERTCAVLQCLSPQPHMLLGAPCSAASLRSLLTCTCCHRAAPCSSTAPQPAPLPPSTPAGSSASYTCRVQCLDDPAPWLSLLPCQQCRLLSGPEGELLASNHGPSSQVDELHALAMALCSQRDSLPVEQSSNTLAATSCSDETLLYSIELLQHQLGSLAMAFLGSVQQWGPKALKIQRHLWLNYNESQSAVEAALRALHTE